MRLTCLLFPLIGGVMFPPNGALGEASLHPFSWSWGQKILSPEKQASLYQEQKRALPLDGTEAPSTRQLRPFLPFFNVGAPAGPLRPRRRDGTFKGRVTKDTLPTLKDTYTTLDKLQQKGASKRGHKGPIKKVRGGLGGLHPEEVFYADEDLIIIRGGGFGGGAPSYADPPQEIESEGLFIPALPPSPPTLGGGGGGGGGVPTLGEEYNGNIPSILPSPVSTSRFSPLSLFFPYSPPSPSPSPSPQASQSLRRNTYMQPRLGHRFGSQTRPRFGPQIRPRFRPRLDTGMILRRCLYYYLPHSQMGGSHPRHPPSGPMLQNYFLLNHIHSPASPLHRAPRPPLRPFITTPVGHSLEGDTDVNYASRRPPANPDAEIVHTKSHPKSTRNTLKKPK